MQIRALKAAARDTTGLAIGQRTAPLTVSDKGMLLGEEAAEAGGTRPQDLPGPTVPIAGATSWPIVI